MVSRAIGVAMLAAGSLIGCARAPAGGEGNKTEATTPSPEGTFAARRQPARSTSVEHLKLDVPRGWSRRARGAWQVFTSPDELSVLALGPLGDGAIATELTEAAQLLGASDVSVGDDQPITIGPDHLPARAADGPCRFRSSAARIAYAAVDLGDGHGALLIHLSTKDVSADARKMATAAAGSLARR